VIERGVRILGPVNLPATLPHHASQMFGRNVLALVNELVKDGQVDLSGEIASAMVVTSRQDQ
jgi:NAD(P) transhydrogenase subunit alpha